MTFLNEQEKQPKAEITAVAKTLPGCKNLISIKGIGEIGAAILPSTTVDIWNFAKSVHLAAFLGMTPSVSQSKVRGTRSIDRGKSISM